MKQKSHLALDRLSSGSHSSLVITVALAGLFSPLSDAANRTWSGGGADTNWSTAANWSAAPVSGADTLIFAGSTKLTNVNNLTPDFIVTGLSFTNTTTAAGAFAITGNRITLGGNITTTASTALTDSLGLAMILNGNRTVTTNTSHSLTITGIISEDASSRSLSKLGAATLTLQGANTFTGSLQTTEGTLTLSGANGSANLSSGIIINGVTFNLNNTSAANNTNRLNDSGTVSMNGGTFNFGNNAGAVNYSETTGALSFIRGANTVSSGQAATGQTSALTFASVSRSLGATTNFSGTGLGVDARNRILFTANPTLSNNMMGGWATVNTTDWASYDATNGVTALASGSYTSDTWASGNNTTVTTSSAPASASLTNSLRFGSAAANTVTLDGINTITSGGILVSSGVGANLSTITGGALQGPDGGELVIQQHNSSGGLTIGSIIQNQTNPSSLVKTGGGILTLTASNTYSGGTLVNGGSLILINSGSGETLQGPITLSGSGRLLLGKSDQISDTSVITFASGANSARFQLNNAAGVSYNETIGGLADAAGTFTGSRIVESANDGTSNAPATLTINTATGQTYNYGGLIRNAAGTLSPAGSSNLSIVKDGLGTQEFSGTGVNYSGNTTVKAGILKLSGTLNNNSAISLEGGSIEFSTASVTGLTRSTAITGTVSTGGVIKSGTGLVTFTADNSYTGTTIVNNGTLKLDRSGGTLADTSTVTVSADSAILDVNQSDTIGILNLANSATVSGAGVLTVSTAIAPNIAIGKTSTISASLAGDAYLRKTGQGTTILSAANSYTGGTILSGTNSKLTISGSGTLGSTAGALSIETASAILDLGGTSQTVSSVTAVGTVNNGTLNVSTQLSLGDPLGVDAIGSASFNGLTMGAASTYSFGVQGGTLLADVGNVTGALAITSGAKLDLVQLGTYLLGEKFTLFAYTAVGGLSGTFKDAGSVTLADGDIFADAGGSWQIDYDDATAGLNGGTGDTFVTITAVVPEPNVALLVSGLGVFGLLRRRRA